MSLERPGVVLDQDLATLWLVRARCEPEAESGDRDLERLLPARVLFTP